MEPGVVLSYTPKKCPQMFLIKIILMIAYNEWSSTPPLDFLAHKNPLDSFSHPFIPSPSSFNIIHSNHNATSRLLLPVSNMCKTHPLVRVLSKYVINTAFNFVWPPICVSSLHHEWLTDWHGESNERWGCKNPTSEGGGLYRRRNSHKMLSVQLNHSPIAV